DSQSNSDMVTTSSTMSSGSAMMLDQISSDECPTPITKRKDDDCDLQDLTSSSKKQCTKIIKEEKIKND
ncbi:BnaAnng23940D, partial [Brassica napus]